MTTFNIIAITFSLTCAIIGICVSIWFLIKPLLIPKATTGEFLDEPQEMLMVHNNSKTDIGIGSVCYLTGSFGKYPHVDIANPAIVPDKKKIYGVALDDIDHESYGFMSLMPTKEA